MSRLPSSFPLYALLPRYALPVILASLLLLPDAVSAQQPPPAPPPPPPAPAPAPVVSPVDQLADAISNRNLKKVTTLLQGDPTLAKTPSSMGTPPLVQMLQSYWGNDTDSMQMFQKLFDDGADVNAADRSGTTPLQAALTRGSGNTDLLALLLDKGADIKTKNAEGRNALLLAVAGTNTAAVTLLLRRGADVNTRSSAGDTPLHLAVLSQNQDLIDALLNAGANVNLRNDRGEMPIHLAMRLTGLQSANQFPSRFNQGFGPGNRQDKTRGNPLLVPQLLDRGAQINARDQTGMTPLMFALLNRDKINYAVLMQRHAALDTLTTVLNAAATNNTVLLAHLLKTLPDFKDLRASNGANALHVAALWDAPDAVRLLLHSGGLDTTTRDAAEETPLHYACWFPENAPMVSLLLDAGANISAEDVFGETPLHMAVHTKSPELLRLLLARKALPDRANAVGETPLSLAVNQDDVDTAKALIAAGASVNQHSRYGSTLLTAAIQRRSIPMVTLLVLKGADVNYVSQNNGDSPLAQAVQGGSKEIVQLLLDKGADVNYKPRYGQSLLSSADNSDRYSHSGIADLLRQHGAK